ncbi:MAG: inorganic diphosphatase [Candidatus Cloacimonetes bacterium HGW-Cloacimonetes-3]|jgi:manganese-dependent inorganic pyrophosphatase|nr:MAG: inorganic diphosphatase [Candidatus Cloacimonetes bacterium HGW-Cloacimonetes-3]
MQKTYIIGHRNPDTDSVCAPYAYTWLKKAIDPEGNYIAGVLGNLNPQTEFIFSKLGIEPPALLRDVCPKAEDIMNTNIWTASDNDPVGMVTKLIDEHHIRSIPVTDTDNNYTGLVTVLGLAQYFMPKPYESRPLYTLRPENFDKVMPGCFLKTGTVQEMETRLMVGAMAFDTFILRLKQSMEDHKHQYPALIVGNRPDIIDYSLKQDFPILILTGMSHEECKQLDTKAFKGWIYISDVDTAETIRLLRTSIPVKAIANTQQPVLKPTDGLATIKKTLMNLDHHGLAVLNGKKLLGLVSSSSLIDPPKHRVIMVDHNEASQSAEGIEQAEVIEILDHHRLGAIHTTNPIYVYARPLGSSCTIVYKHFRNAGVTPPAHIAAMLLSGILSDTIILRSPTTTPQDVKAAEALAEIANLNIQDWGTDIFRHAASLTSANPDLAISSDFKIYTEHGYRVGIAQMEVITLNDLRSVEKDYLEALIRTQQKFALDWALLMITDIIEEESILLTTEFAPADQLKYPRLDECTFHLPAVLSRKKQLLPEILHVLSQ